MAMHNFRHGDFTFRYTRRGDGPHVLLAFHGYGRDHTDFDAFVAPMLGVFTVYAFDLPFHGESETGARSPVTEPWEPAELREIFHVFLQGLGAKQVWVMGYSLGGRVAIKLAEVLPERVGGLYLFAPDGLKPNFWYVFLSETSVGRMVFRWFREHPGVFFTLMELGRKMGWVDRKMHHFLTSQVADNAMRTQVYNVWTFYRKIKVDRKDFARVAKAHHITVDVFCGKFDKIIPPSNVRKLTRLLPETRLQLLETGHAMLTASTGQYVWEERFLTLPSDAAPPR